MLKRPYKKIINGPIILVLFSSTLFTTLLYISEGTIRRLLDIDHRSHIGQIDAVLAVFGKRLVVEVQEAA